MRTTGEIQKPFRGAWRGAGSSGFFGFFGFAQQEKHDKPNKQDKLAEPRRPLVCLVTTVLVRQTIRDHLHRSRPASKNRVTSLDLARDGELVPRLSSGP